MTPTQVALVRAGLRPYRTPKADACRVWRSTKKVFEMDPSLCPLFPEVHPARKFGI